MPLGNGEFNRKVMDSAQDAHMAIYGLAPIVAASIRFPSPEAKMDAIAGASLHALLKVESIRSAKNPEAFAFDVIRQKILDILRHDNRRRYVPLSENTRFARLVPPTLSEARAAREPHRTTDATRARQINSRITNALGAINECTGIDKYRVEGMIESMQAFRYLWYGSYRVCRLDYVRFTRQARIPIDN